MDKPNFKIYLILVLILAVLFILYLILTFVRQKKEEITTAPEIPTPTLVEEPINLSPTKELPPDIIHPTDFTGVLEEKMPPDVKALSEQKQGLKINVPLSQPLFSIDFDYGEDKFIVNLKDPKDQARSSFDDWLKSNYPAIPLDRFIIN